jgi:hypothetical protein
VSGPTVPVASARPLDEVRLDHAVTGELELDERRLEDGLVGAGRRATCEAGVAEPSEPDANAPTAMKVITEASERLRLLGTSKLVPVRRSNEVIFQMM